jgi:serine/threonine protein phosphatase PrpC
MKKAPFTTLTSFQAPPGECVPSLFIEPLLSAEPEIHSRVLEETDEFIIFGTSGLWKLLTNEQAAKIVLENPREVYLWLDLLFLYHYLF